MQFNPAWDDVNRIVDYTTAMEATLFAEDSYNWRRMSSRATALLFRVGSPEAGDVAERIKTVHRIRSVIVHGIRLNSEDRRWLGENWESIELTVRRIPRAALEEIPPGEQDRRLALAALDDWDVEGRQT